MTTIERSTDYRKIRTLLTDSKVYSRMVSDDAPSPELLRELPTEGIEYIAAWREGALAAAFLLIEQGPNVMEVHFCFAPKMWGKTLAIARDFMTWLWREKRVSVAIGPVPAYNSLALRLAKKVGFEEYQREPEAVTKNGKPYDLILTRMERPAA